MADLFISWKKTATQKEKQCNKFSFSHMLRHASNSTTWHCSQTICSSRIGLVEAKCEGKDTVKRSDIIFLEQAGELRIFILREEKKSLNANSSPYFGLEQGM